MQIYRIESGQLNLRLGGTAAAFGRFDALHRGHMSIIGRAVGYAEKHGLKSLVYMFENEPAEVISGRQVKSVNTVSKRLEILEKAGVDIAVVQKFDKTVMNMPCERFINDYIREAFDAKYIAVGFNYRFGRNAEGTAEYLRDECRKFGTEVYIEEGISDSSGVISSTRIRELIADCRVDVAAELMGRYFSVSGIIVRGHHIGSDRLGFPTANIKFPKDCIVPGYGVYTTTACVKGRRFPAITNVGGKPTLNDGGMLIETHICGEFGDLYGERIEIEFCEFIRGIRKFDSLDDLANQLKKDRDRSEKFYITKYAGGITNE